MEGTVVTRGMDIGVSTDMNVNLAIDSPKVKIFKRSTRPIDSAICEVDLGDIKVSEIFANTIPAKSKLDDCRDYWRTYQRQDRFIVLDSDNVLIDGYVQYLILKELGEMKAQVLYSEVPGYKKPKHNYSNANSYLQSRDVWDDGYKGNKNNEIIYVYGRLATHVVPGKEYVWRIPKSWTDFASEVKIGDDILCPTRYGSVHVIVTRIKKGYGIPPKKVKRVAARKIWRSIV